MAVKTEAQTAIDERLLEHDELEAVLEKRQKTKERVSAVRSEYNQVDEQAKGMLAEFALEDGEVARCGRFRIAKKHVPSRSVAFETDPRSRLTIRTIEEAA